jgi:hypothetical protein
MNLERRELRKYSLKINRGSKGRDNELEYKCWWYCSKGWLRQLTTMFILLLWYWYTNFKTVEDVKKKTWKDIILDLKVHLKRNLRSYIFLKVYIKHHLIYSRMITLLGQLKELTTYTDETKYYIKSRQYAKITGTRKSL